MAHTSKISKVKKTLKDSVSVTTGTVGHVVGKARETIESVAPLIPGRGSGPDKKSTTPAPGPASTKKPAKKPAKKTAAKKTAAKKTTAKKTAAKKTAGKKTATKKAAAN